MFQAMSNTQDYPQLNLPKKKTSKHSEDQLFKKSFQEFAAIRYEKNDTLKHSHDRKKYIETDSKFIEDVGAIASTQKDLFHILQDRKQSVKLSDIECDEIDFNARLHRRANMVNQNTELALSKVDQGHHCKCGCNRAKGNFFPLCVPINNLKVLGSGVVLFFMFKKGIILNLIVAVLIFGIYSTISNLEEGGLPSIQDECLDSQCELINNASAQNNKSALKSSIQYILGVVLCSVWIFTLRIVKYFGKKQNAQVDDGLNSASDSAVQISNLPFGQYDEDQLIQYFQNLWDQIQKRDDDKNLENVRKMEKERNGFRIKSLQIVYNMQFSRQIIAKIISGCTEIDGLFENDSNGITKNCIRANDIQKYRQLKLRITQNYELLMDLRKKFLTDNLFRKKLSTSCCIVELHSEKDKNFLMDKYGKGKYGLLKSLQIKFKKLFCPEQKNIFFKGKILSIQRAPEPSDILWQNCQKKYSLIRIVVIYLITFAIILVSFALIIGVRYFNQIMSQDKSNSNGLIAQVLSMSTSVALLIINKVLWFSLFYLLNLEYNYSLTDKIISQMNKVLFATCINIIVLPMIINIVLKDNLYGKKGLAGLVFDYHITVITAGLLSSLVNPIGIIKLIIANVKCLRKIFLQQIRKGYDVSEAKLFENWVNKFYEGDYFDVAEAYIWIMGNLFHAAFFCSLQPFILIIVLIEVFVYFWINKIKILRICKIPQMTELLVFETALSHAGLVPIMYGLGSVLITYIQYLQNKQYHFSLIFPVISIAIGVFGFVNPGDILNKLVEHTLSKCIQDTKIENKQSQNEEFSGNQLVKKDLLVLSEPKQKISRVEDYYSGSNSLSLIGFQNMLKVKPSKEVVQQLRNYCQSFFSQTDPMVENVLQGFKLQTIKIVGDTQSLQKDDNSEMSSI